MPWRRRIRLARRPTGEEQLWLIKNVGSLVESGPRLLSGKGWECAYSFDELAWNLTFSDERFYTIWKLTQ